MLINEFNFTNTTFEEARENETHEVSDFPLFNMDALKRSFSQNNCITLENLDDILEEITAKKSKNNYGTEVVVKKRGRKPVAKNGKSWDDPTITMKEIIENDLAGEPTVAETNAKNEKMRKMREAKALKRARRNGLVTEANTPELEKNASHGVNACGVNDYVPHIVFKDGKIVVEGGNHTVVEGQKNQGLVLAETNGKKKKLNSMSFRTKEHTSKWTEEETRKFYKAIELFGADFSLIAKLFSNRNRNQLKNKYNKESKVNSKMVDEAFKKNALISKRSFMERIKLFEKQVKNVRDGNEELELVPVNMERNYSNNSTDSLDLKVLEEIQDVFVKEMREGNRFKDVLNGTAFGVNNSFLTKQVEWVVEQELEESEEDLNEDVVKKADAFVNYAQEENEEVAVVQNFGQKENLLLRLFN